MNQSHKGRGSCSLGVTVFCVCVGFFFPPGAGITTLALCPKCSARCSSSRGPKRCSASIWPCNAPRSWTSPLTSAWWTITQVKRKPSEGKMRRLQRTDTQTQSMDKVQQANTPSQGKSQPPMHFSLDLFLFWRLFSPTTLRNGGRWELQHPQTIPSTWQMSKILPWS